MRESPSCALREAGGGVLVGVRALDGFAQGFVDDLFLRLGPHVQPSLPDVLYLKRVDCLDHQARLGSPGELLHRLRACLGLYARREAAPHRPLRHTGACCGTTLDGLALQLVHSRRARSPENDSAAGRDLLPPGRRAHRRLHGIVRRGAVHPGQPGALIELRCAPPERVGKGLVHAEDTVWRVLAQNRRRGVLQRQQILEPGLHLHIGVSRPRHRPAPAQDVRIRKAKTSGVFLK
mmetsp:Transcript_41562/g.81208  ORF Transcript_41562/g.81208 Transcript_41562/m.81208 type:complete len:235 (-) Transcript_41562:152-856(-)